VAASPAHASALLTQQAFLERVGFTRGEIRSLSSSIQEIASLYQRALSSPDIHSSAQLETPVTQAQLKNTQIRDRIKFLGKMDALKTQDGTKSVKARQAKQLKTEFEKALEDYRQEEAAYGQRYREQIAMQYRIFNLDAIVEEVNEASELD
jgi:syntaxin 1B/2/3